MRSRLDPAEREDYAARVGLVGLAGPLPGRARGRPQKALRIPLCRAGS